MPSNQKVEEKRILFLDFELFIGGFLTTNSHEFSLILPVGRQVLFRVNSWLFFSVFSVSSVAF